MNSQIFKKILALFSQEMSNCGCANYSGKLQTWTEPWDQMAQHQKGSQAARPRGWTLLLGKWAPRACSQRCEPPKFNIILSWRKSYDLRSSVFHPRCFIHCKEKICISSVQWQLLPLYAEISRGCNVQPQAAKFSKTHLKVVNTLWVCKLWGLHVRDIIYFTQ